MDLWRGLAGHGAARLGLAGQGPAWVSMNGGGLQKKAIKDEEAQK
jgi:hypothetical protein